MCHLSASFSRFGFQLPAMTSIPTKKRLVEVLRHCDVCAKDFWTFMPDVFKCIACCRRLCLDCKTSLLCKDCTANACKMCGMFCVHTIAAEVDGGSFCCKRCHRSNGLEHGWKCEQRRLIPRNPIASFDTTAGAFEVEIFLDRVPRTASNFIDLALLQ